MVVLEHSKQCLTIITELLISTTFIRSGNAQGEVFNKDTHSLSLSLSIILLSYKGVLATALLLQSSVCSKSNDYDKEMN